MGIDFETTELAGAIVINAWETAVIAEPEERDEESRPQSFAQK